MLTTHINLVLRLDYAEIYLHSLQCLHGTVLNLNPLGWVFKFQHMVCAKH